MLAAHRHRKKWSSARGTLFLALFWVGLALDGMPPVFSAALESKSGSANEFLSQTNASSAGSNSATTLRPPVHPRRNVDEFSAVRAKFVRFTIFKTNRGEPCLDELEIFTADAEPRNVALASAGAKVTVSGTLAGYRIHKSEHLNDGFYGNGRSWISGESGRGWVVVELPALETINKVVWGRDREGKFIDRLVTEYKTEVASDALDWRLVASSADRRPLKMGAEYSGENPGQRLTVNRFAPVGTTLSPDDSVSVPGEYTINVWQTENGLPSNTIRAIVQTRDGYLWLGTFNGLVRFDGFRFVVFGEAEGLRNPRIVCLHEDHAGTLWIGTEGGGLIGCRDGQFTAYTTAEGLSSNGVLSITEDRERNLWVGTAAGLDCLRNGKFVRDSNHFGTAARAVYRVMADRAANLWVITSRLRLLKDGREIAPPFEGEPASFTSLYSIHEGFSGSVWVGGANGYVARLKDGQVTAFGKEHGLLPDLVWEIFEARNGDVWVGTASGGLNRLRAGKFTAFTTQEGLSNNSVSSICEDKEGNIWVGTNGGGLIRLKAKTLSTFTTRSGLSHDVVMSLAEDHEHQIWIGSNCGGLNLWRHNAVAPFHINYLLDNECIWSLCAGRPGVLWIGSWGGGLFQKTGDKIVNYGKADGLSDDVILALCEEASGGLWIGTYAGGLNYFRDGQFVHYTAKEGLSANFVTAIIEERPGAIWIGTSGGGLNRLADGKFSAYRRQDGLASDFVRTLHRDSEGNLWIGTSGGLSLLKGERCFSITTRHGLIDNVISQILEDNHGNLWLGSNEGISRVEKRELRHVAEQKIPRVNPVSFGKAEGMESLECTGGFHPAGLKSSDGTLWFSTVKGVVRVDPNHVTLNDVLPPVVIEEMLIDGKPETRAISKPKLRSSNPVVLAPGVQRVEFRYTALSFVAPEKIKFKYRMEGLDQTWIEGGGRRAAIYTHLPAGDYHFRVVASNNDGIWNETGASLRLTMPPQFWQTWWFVGSAALATVGIGGGAARYIVLRKVRTQLLRLEQQHALEKERSRIARDIHDDLGAGLTQISLLSDLGQKNSGNRQEVEANFRQISTRAGEIVQAMDAIVWAVNPKNDTLDNLANYLTQFAKDFLDCTPIRCRIDVPPLLPEVALSAEIRHNVFLTVKEALNNIVKHSGASEVWIRVSEETGAFSITIQDNGRGFHVPQISQFASGQGLRNMKKRLEEIEGKLEVESQPGQGTAVKLVLPFIHRLESCL